MPSKLEKVAVGRPYDRRVKLTPADKEKIKELRTQEGLSYMQLATLFKVSKRTVQFIVRPELAVLNAARFKERRKDGRYYDKAKHTLAMRTHRRYKDFLHSLNLI